MKIGVLCEGKADIPDAIVFVKRAVSATLALSVNDVECSGLSTKGSIAADDIATQINILFTTLDPEYLCIFFDLDDLAIKPRRKKIRQIRNSVTTCLPVDFPPEKVCYSFSECEFEELLLVDEDTLKGLLKLDGALRLPNSELLPKERLTSLFDRGYKEKRLDITEPPSIIRERVATNAELAKLRAVQGFDDLFRFFDTVARSGYQ